MLTRTKAPLFLCAALTFANVAFASEAGDARRAIENAYKRTDAAVARRDSKTILSYMKPGYHITMLGRTWSKSRVSRNMNELFSNAKTLQTKTSIRSFILRRGKATVVAQELGQITAVSQRTHELNLIKTNSIFEEVWVEEKGQWLKQRTTNLRIQETFNGKSIKPVVAK